MVFYTTQNIEEAARNAVDANGTEQPGEDHD
jgi:hypothetical protein